MNPVIAGNLIDQFMETGLLMFGDFAAREGRMPFLARFELLASYPDVLDVCVHAAAPLAAAQQPSRLLCAADALPFGVALALQTGIPLVFSRGGEKAAVDDLVGAYDIGHKSTLIVNVVDKRTPELSWVSAARRVGVETVGIIALMEAQPPDPAVPAHALTRLTDIAMLLAARNLLPLGHAQVLMRWVGA
jgi:hypothetical protein